MFALAFERAAGVEDTLRQMPRKMDRGCHAIPVSAESRRRAALALRTAIATEPIRKRDRLPAASARLDESYSAFPAMPAFARVRCATCRAVHGTPGKAKDMMGRTYARRYPASSLVCDRDCRRDTSVRFISRVLP